jgi:hypothetical protein
VVAQAALPDGSVIDLTLPTTTLIPGQIVTASFSYTVTASDPSPVTAVVTASGTGATAGTVTDSGSASVQITISSVDLTVVPLNCGFP